MKLRLTLVAVPVLALVVVAAAFAGRRERHHGVGPERRRSPAARLARSGSAAPITGPAASIGQQQLRWAQFYVKRWNALKANAKRKIAIVQGDTQLGVDTAFAVKVAQSFASNPKVLGVVGPAGSQEVVASTSALQGAGLGLGLRIRDPRLADRRPHGRRQPAGLLLPDGAERRHPGPDGGELHPPEAQGDSASSSSTTRRRTRRASPTTSRRTSRPRASASPATRSARTRPTSPR